MNPGPSNPFEAPRTATTATPELDDVGQLAYSLSIRRARMGLYAIVVVYAGLAALNLLTALGQAGLGPSVVVSIPWLVIGALYGGLGMRVEQNPQPVVVIAWVLFVLTFVITLEPIVVRGLVVACLLGVTTTATQARKIRQGAKPE
ncbi:MAG: hypothetical protein IT384_04000 [Deltaproteobacteria bacterium]|nr:hypothetical protein [Deltaproteobacteria bacterium]